MTVSISITLVLCFLPRGFRPNSCRCGRSNQLDLRVEKRYKYGHLGPLHSSNGRRIDEQCVHLGGCPVGAVMVKGRNERSP